MRDRVRARLLIAAGSALGCVAVTGVLHVVGGGSVPARVAGLALMWVVAVALLVLRTRETPEPPRRRVRPTDVLLGIAAGVAGALAVPLLSLAAGSLLGDTGLTTAVAPLPVWLVIAGVITAGVTEEVIFRAVPMDALRAAGAPRALEVLLPLAAFVASHAWGWNTPHVVGVVLPLGVGLALLYLWRRSLVTNVVAHLLVDAPLVVIALAA